jgi:hypothetical protein
MAESDEFAAQTRGTCPKPTRRRGHVWGQSPDVSALDMAER